MGGTGQEGGDIYRHIAGLLPCTAETNIMKQLYPSLKKKTKKLSGP